MHLRLRLLAIAVATSLSHGSAHADDSEKLAVQGIESRIDQLEAKLAAQQAKLDAQQAELDRRRKELDEVETTTTMAATVDPAAVKEPTFRLYGFIDMGLQKLWTSDQSVVETTAGTFVLGNVNLYLDFRPVDSWSSLIEVRLTNYPSGSETVGNPAAGVPYQRVSTDVLDPGNGVGDDTVRWGAIVLERAYIEWHQHDALSLRVGEFLTPYGIWNVDHGTPTLISLYRPEFVSRELWPSHQLGIEMFGRFDHVLADRWELEYHAYISNGRTQGTVDLTDDKMVGGRVVMSTTHPRMAFGMSFMSGNYSEQAHDWDPTTDITTRPELVAYNETGVAVDASIDLGGLRLRSELTTRRIDYTDGERAQTALPGVYQADALQGDFYVLGAYRIPDTRYEPYLYTEALRVPDLNGDLLVTASAGLNIYFTPAIQLKLQYAHVRLFDTAAFAFNSTQDTETFVAAKLVMGF